MNENERENLIYQLNQFSTLHSLEVAKGNLHHLDLLLSCSQKDVQIRRLKVENLKNTSSPQMEKLGYMRTA